MDESAEDLRRKFTDLLEQDFEEPNRRWLAIWHLFLKHPWYDAQLKGCAQYVRSQYGLPPDQVDDIEQSARLLLGKSLQRAPDLHVDPKRAKSHFEPWLRTIILRDCRQAVRSLKDRRVSDTPVPDDLPYESPEFLHVELAEAFHTAVQQLSQRQRLVVLLVGKDMSWVEIAEQAGVSERQVRRDYERGIERLRWILRIDRE